MPEWLEVTFGLGEVWCGTYSYAVSNGTFNSISSAHETFTWTQIKLPVIRNKQQFRINKWFFSVKRLCSLRQKTVGNWLLIPIPNELQCKKSRHGAALISHALHLENTFTNSHLNWMHNRNLTQNVYSNSIWVWIWQHFIEKPNHFHITNTIGRSNLLTCLRIKTGERNYFNICFLLLFNCIMLQLCWGKLNCMKCLNIKKKFPLNYCHEISHHQPAIRHQLIWQLIDCEQWEEWAASGWRTQDELRIAINSITYLWKYEAMLEWFESVDQISIEHNSRDKKSRWISVLFDNDTHFQE